MVRSSIKPFTSFVLTEEDGLTQFSFFLFFLDRYTEALEKLSSLEKLANSRKQDADTLSREKDTVILPSPFIATFLVFPSHYFICLGTDSEQVPRRSEQT